MKLSDIARAVKETGKPANTWSLLIYGDPKSGKSRLAGTIAKVPYIKRVHYIDGENGSEVLETMVRTGVLSMEDAEKVNVYKIPDTPDNPMFFETGMKMLTEKKDLTICEPHGKVHCVVCADKDNFNKPVKFKGQTFNISKCTDEDVVVIDSGSQLGASVLAYYCKGKPIDFKPGWDEYGPQGRVLSDMLSVIQNAKTNFIVITHQLLLEIEENDKKFDKLYPLMGTKAFSLNVAKYFGHVAYLHKAMNLHKGGTGSTYRKDVITGSRGGWQLESAKSPDLSLLFEALRNGGAGK